MTLVCNYYLTYECNMACSFCSIPKHAPESKVQTIKQIESNLRDLKRLGVKVIDFTGGEPLLYPELSDALQAAKQHGFITTVTTNGLLYPKLAHALKGKVDMMRISLHFLPVAKKALAAAKTERQKVMLHFVATNQNVPLLPRISGLAAETRTPVRLAVCFSYFGNPALGEEHFGLISREWLKPFVYADLAQLELSKKGGNQIEMPVCRAASNAITISPDNCLLLPCYHKCREKISLSKGLFNAFNSKKAARFRQMEGKFPFCQGCNVYCYMRSSFHKNPFSKLFWLRLASIAKFGIEWSRPQF
ncbi:MAG: radical SAM protein [Candidatus Diapherotrites archaeon]|nr:radical SAM protein [Candidatus Diapherotrites archaeon]